MISCSWRDTTPRSSGSWRTKGVPASRLVESSSRTGIMSSRVFADTSVEPGPSSAGMTGSTTCQASAWPSASRPNPTRTTSSSRRSGSCLATSRSAMTLLCASRVRPRHSPGPRPTVLSLHRMKAVLLIIQRGSRPLSPAHRNRGRSLEPWRHIVSAATYRTGHGGYVTLGWQPADLEHTAPVEGHPL